MDSVIYVHLLMLPIWRVHRQRSVLTFDINFGVTSGRDRSLDVVDDLSAPFLKLLCLRSRNIDRFWWPLSYHTRYDFIVLV